MKYSSLVLLISVLKMIRGEEEKVTESWISLPYPIFSSDTSTLSLFSILFSIQLGLVIMLSFLPYKKLQRFQDHITVGLGFFFLTGTFLFFTGLYLIPILAWIVAYIGAIIAVAFSLQRRFHKLLLSVGGGYVASYFFIMIFRVQSFTTYVIMFTIFSLCLYFISRILDLLFYCICKALIYTLALIVEFDIITPMNAMGTFHGKVITMRKTMMSIGILEILIFFSLIFSYSYFIEKKHIQKGEKKAAKKLMNDLSYEAKKEIVKETV